MSNVIEIETRGPYALSEAATFWRGFVPSRGTAVDAESGLALFFRQDGDFRAIAATLRQTGERVLAETTGEPNVVAKQLARMLSLDVDPTPWRAILDRDPTLQALEARWPGFRPVCFASPWEAAAWGVLVQGIGMARAARLREQLAARYGECVEIAGVSSALLPAPATILSLPTLEGLDPERARRLYALAERAAAGALDAERLRAMPTDEALAELRTIRGVGEWTASHTLLRGAALADGDALDEPRVRRAIEASYGFDHPPTDEECATITDGWRPLRMWGSILTVRSLAKTKGWRNTPGDRRARGKKRS